MRYFYLLLLGLLLSASPLCSQPHVDTARKYIGVKELTGNNDGPFVEKYLRFVGLGKGYKWCAAFVSWVLHQAKVSYPQIRTALARNFVTNRSILSSKVYNGYVDVPRGALAIWQRGNGISGHIGITWNWKGKSGYVIEGNANNRVSKVWRTIEPYNYFRIKWFTPVWYE